MSANTEVLIPEITLLAQAFFAIFCAFVTLGYFLSNIWRENFRFYWTGLSIFLVVIYLDRVSVNRLIRTYSALTAIFGLFLFVPNNDCFIHTASPCLGIAQTRNCIGMIFWSCPSCLPTSTTEL